MSKTLSSKRAKAREAAKQKRLNTLAFRRRLLDLVVGGHPYDVIAEKSGVSVSTVKRHVRRALDARPPEPAETFVALQRARLEKALQYNDILIEEGNVRAIAALASLLPHLDRYWGLQNALRAARAGVEGAQILAPTPLKSLETQTGLPPQPAKAAQTSS